MGARILIADANETRAEVEELLAGEYFEVVRAGSGPEVVEICGMHGCDIAVLDLELPSAGGLRYAGH